MSPSENETTPFTVYYGHDPAEVDRIVSFELAVLESRGWDPESWTRLQASPTKLIGYLSPFAWPDWLGKSRWWWGKKERDQEWGAWWYSLSSWGWRKRMSQMWRELPQGLDGYFFDNIDRLERDPASLPYFLRLLNEIRASQPNAVLIGNRGFTHWSRLRGHLDGILFENLTDQSFSLSDKKWVVSQLESLQDTTVYALDYQTRRVEVESRRLLSLFPKLLYYCAPDESLQSIKPMSCES